jgi:hypothetical protein
VTERENYKGKTRKRKLEKGNSKKLYKRKIERKKRFAKVDRFIIENRLCRTLKQ